jgi:hypothetical protein
MAGASCRLRKAIFAYISPPELPVEFPDGRRSPYKAIVIPLAEMGEREKLPTPPGMSCVAGVRVSSF